MKLMEGECIYTPARPRSQLPTSNRSVFMGSNSGARNAARLLDPLSMSKVRRRLFDGDFESSSELSKPFRKTATPAASTEDSEYCRRLLEEYQQKWNFDLVNCVPLDGRYVWEKMKREDVPEFYSRSYSDAKHRDDIQKNYSENMVANGSGLSNENTTRCPLRMDITIVSKTNSDNNNGNNNIPTTNTSNNNKYNGCDSNIIYNVAASSSDTNSTTTRGGMENTNDKRHQDITDKKYNDNRTHSGTYSCNNNNNNDNNVGSSSSSTTSSDSLLERGKSPLCFTSPVKNVNTSSNQLRCGENADCDGPLLGSHQRYCNDNNNNFSEKSDSCDTLTKRLFREQLDSKRHSNSTSIDTNNATISLSSSSSPSSSSAPSSPSSLSPPCSSPLPSYSPTTLAISSPSLSTTYPNGTLNETRLLGKRKQSKIVDYMPHKKRTLSCHTGNRERKLRKE